MEKKHEWQQPIVTKTKMKAWNSTHRKAPLIHKCESSVLVVRGRGGQRARDGAAERARRVQLRGRPARAHRVHAALHPAARAAPATPAGGQLRQLSHQVHAHLP